MSFRMIFGFITLFMLSSIAIKAQAPYQEGAELLNEQLLVNKLWHLTSKEDGQPLLRANGAQVEATNQVIDNSSTWVIEPGGDDGDWWTADKRWFYIYNLENGLYLTVDQPGATSSSTSLQELDEGNPAQQFRVVTIGEIKWWRIRSKVSEGNAPDLVLELVNGQIRAEKPEIIVAQQQKFAFTLAFPVEGSYSIINSASGHFLSDNGIASEGNTPVHNRFVDESCKWKLKKVPGTNFYQFYNPLTQLYLARKANEGAGSLTQMTSDSNHTATHWQFVHSNARFRIKTRDGDFFLAQNNNPGSGSPLYIINDLADNSLGQNWLVVPLPNEPVMEVKNFSRILEGTPYPGCILNYGTLFKKALSERIGLDPANFERNFVFIREALSAKYGLEKVDELLQKFDLANPGHRIDLGLCVLEYLTVTLKNQSSTQWSLESTYVVEEYEGKIEAIRQAYAVKLDEAWTQLLLDNNGNFGQTFSTLFANNSTENYNWPSPYDAVSGQEGRLLEFASGAAYFNSDQFQNLYKLTGVATSAVLGLGSNAIGSSLLQMSLSKFAQVSSIVLPADEGVEVAATAAASAGKQATGLSYQTLKLLSKIFSNAAIIVTVAVNAALIIAAEVKEVNSFQEFEDNINAQIAWANTPVTIQVSLQGNNRLNQVRMYNDLSFIIGGGLAQPNFSFNTNDNAYLQPLDFNLITLPGQPDNTVDLELGPGGTASLSDNLFGTTQYCGDEPEFSYSKGTFNCSDIGQDIQVMVKASTNLGSVNFEVEKPITVKVVDKLAPSLVCPGLKVVSAPPSSCQAMVSFTASAADNCGTAMVSSVPASNSLFPVGTTEVTFTASDNKGNSSSCKFMVTVNDVTPPAVQCKPFTTFLSSNGQASITPQNVFLSGSDDCGTVTLEMVQPATFSCANLGIQQVVLKVNDGNGNTSTCQASVTVSDNIKPIAKCKNGITNVFLDAAGNYTLLPSVVNNNSTDNCAVTGMTVAPASFTCAQLGLRNVTLTATDQSSNTSTCTARIRLRDNIKPEAKCQPVTASISGNGYAYITVYQVNNGSTDNCTVSGLSLSKSQFSCSNIGLNTVTLTVTDQSINAKTCTAAITITDNTPPVAKCKELFVQLGPSGQASITAAQINNNSTDGCGIADMSVTPSQFSCSDIGANVVVLTVNDPNGNSATCWTQVYLGDNLAPTATCQSAVTNLDANGTATILPALVNNGSFDNCPGLSMSVVPGTITSAGQHTVSLFVTDALGNIGSCTATVNVLPANASRSSLSDYTPNSALEVQLAPNPASGTAYLRFVLEKETDIYVQIVNYEGRSLWSNQLTGVTGENTVPVEVHQIPPGLYLVRLAIPDHPGFTKRLVVGHPH